MVWVRSVCVSACVWFGRGVCVGVHVCGLGEECVWECMCVVWVRSVCGSACVWFG